MQSETLGENYCSLSNVTDDHEQRVDRRSKEDILFNGTEIEINLDAVMLTSVIKIEPMSASNCETILIESDEEFADEPGRENIEIEFGEHPVTVSPKADFLDESFERETSNEFHLRLDSDTDDDEDERIIHPYEGRSPPARPELKPESESDSNVETRTENVGIELVTVDECAATVSPEAVPTRETVESQPPSKRKHVWGRPLQLNFRLHFETPENDKDKRTIPCEEEERLSPAPILKNSKLEAKGVIFVQVSNDIDRELCRNLKRTASVVLQRCAIPSSSSPQHVSAKRKRGRPKKVTEPSSDPQLVLTKRKIGRPKKVLEPFSSHQLVLAKRKRGRPKKVTELPSEQCELGMSMNETGGRRKHPIRRKRFISDAEIMRKWSASEAPEHRKKRLEYGAEIMKQKSANATPEETEKSLPCCAKTVKRRSRAEECGKRCLCGAVTLKQPKETTPQGQEDTLIKRFQGASSKNFEKTTSSELEDEIQLLLEQCEDFLPPDNKNR